MTLCLAVNLLYSKQKKKHQAAKLSSVFSPEPGGNHRIFFGFLAFIVRSSLLTTITHVESSFVFVVLTIMLSDAMPKDPFLLNLPCSDVYIRGASALIFVTKCESETESSRGTHLQ